MDSPTLNQSACVLARASLNEVLDGHINGSIAPQRPLHTGTAFLTRTRGGKEFGTMCWLIVLTLLVSVMDYSQSLKPGISVKPLQQGLWIQQQGGLYYQTTQWIVLMSVSSPTPTKKLLDFANILETQIKTVSSRFPQLSDSLTSQLTWCRCVLQRLEPARSKRAPLHVGFIGRLSHTLFGTVTEAELAQYRNLLMDNRLSLNRMIHRTNLLMSAVKSNREHINWNSYHLMKIQKYLQTLQSSISSSFKIMSDTVHHLSVKLKLGHLGTVDTPHSFPVK